MRIKMLMSALLILLEGCITETKESVYNIEQECWEGKTLEVPSFYWGPYIAHNGAADQCEGGEYIEYTPLSTCIFVNYRCGYRDLYNDPDVVPCGDSELSCCVPDATSPYVCGQFDIPQDEL